MERTSKLSKNRVVTVKNEGAIIGGIIRLLYQNNSLTEEEFINIMSQVNTERKSQEDKSV
jgi:hypothetical protein